MSNTLLIGKALVTEKTQPASRDLVILSALANRHGLITGATGTGKTVTLQKMAEQFSRIGVSLLKKAILSGRQSRILGRFYLAAYSI